MIIYLAAPYKHEKESVIEYRVDQVNKKAAQLMEQGYIIFSSVSHSHPISKYCQVDPCNSDFWLKQDLPFLHVCDELWIYRLQGWDKSVGIQKEIEYAIRLGKPIRYI